MENPYQPPKSELNKEPDELETDSDELEFVGFWPRFGASLIDTIILLVVIYPILFAIYGEKYFSGEQILAGFSDFLLSYVFPAIARDYFLDIQICHSRQNSNQSQNS
ncbi:hypothetical protein BGS_0628 [Beggiatoa sp. SS]|nr:hypothetical protein BGS_0628 [Beggiatoa sp. SS]